MSSAVNGVPSCHLMSLRSLNSQVLSSSARQLEASAGSSLPPSRELMMESQKCSASERSPAWLLSWGSADEIGSAKAMDRFCAVAAVPQASSAAVSRGLSNREVMGVLLE